MSDINISIDSSDVKTVKQEIDSLRRSFTSAQASASVFSFAFESAIASQVQELDRVYGAFNRVARANQDVINGNLGISNSYKDAASSAKVFARAMLEADRRKADTAFALGAQKAKEEAKATEDLVRAQQRLANETEQLKRKYDATYAAASLYERTLQELDRALSLGALSANKHARAVEELKREYQDFNNNAAGVNNRFAREVSQTSRGLNEFGFVAQQVGYQVGDFFVQVQSGTNWLVAFGQQATQLAGLLPGVLGAVLGIGVSVATAIGATWMRASEDSKAATKNLAEDATSALGEVKSKFEDVSEAAEKYAQAVALAGAIKDTGVTSYLSGLKEELSLRKELLLIEQARWEMKRLELQESIAANKAQIDAIAREVAARFESALGYATNEAEREAIKQRILERTQEELDKNQELLLTQREQIATLGLVDNLLGRMGDTTGKALAEQKAGAEKVNKEHAAQVVYMGKTVAESDRFVASLTRAYGLMAQTKVAAAIAEQKAEAEKVNKEHAAQVVYMGKTVAESDRFVASLTRAYGLMAQTKVAAAQMATNVRNAANAWLVANAPMGTGYLANQYAMYGAGQVASQATIREANPLYGPSPYSEDPTKDSGGAGGAGGVGGASTQTNPWEDLQKELQRQRQLLGLTEQQVSLKEELWRIEDALGEDRDKYSDAQIQSLAQQNLAVKEQLKLQEEANSQMQSLSDTIESSMSDAFMSMVDGTASVKDAFKSMAAAIIKQLFEVLVVQRLVGSWNASTGVGSGLVGAIMGGVFNSKGGGYTGSGSHATITTERQAQVDQRRDITDEGYDPVFGARPLKRVIQRHLQDPLAEMIPVGHDAVGRSGGLGGKGGFLTMVHPDETIIDHTKRKQVAPAAKPASVGSSEAPVVVNQYFNLAANGDESVKRIIKEEAPKLAKQAQAAVLDARRRGGAYGKAF